MANKFLTNIELDAGLVDGSNSTGTSGYLLSSTGTATSWVAPNTITSGSAERTEILVKNVHGSALSKGDPVYIVGSVGASDRLEVALADASDAAKMPCVGLLTQDLANNGEGTATVTGKLRNLITSPIDGATPTENDTIYVKSGGGLTLTKPAGSANLIQNVGQVGRVSTSSDGNIVVSAILRSNDVPNLTTGKIWVGSSTYTTESTVVHLDESNGRMGIGTLTPGSKLSIDSVQQDALSINSSDGDGPYAVWKRQNVNIGFVGNANALSLSGNTNFGVRATNDLVFAAGGTSERMRINSAGYVGIGTTSPSQRTVISGPNTAPSLNSTSVSAASLLISNADVGYGTYFASRGNGVGLIQQRRQTSAVYYDLSLQPHGGNVGIGTDSPANKLDIRQSTSGGSDVLGTGAITIGSDNPYWTFRGTATSLQDLAFDRSYAGTWYESMRIQRSTGNVGIGETNPTSSLEVNGDIRVKNSGRLYLWKDNSNNYIDYNNWIASTGATQSIQNTGSGGISLKTGSSTRLFIDSSGNVGIGTTSPNHKLDIYSNENVPLRIHRPSNANLDSSGAWGIGFSTRGDANTSTSDTRAGIFSYYNGNLFLAAANTSIVADPDAYARLTILNTGYVGIGTPSPSKILHVQPSSTTDDGIKLTTSNGGNLISLYQENSTEAFIRMYSANVQKILLRANGDSYFNGGNVGIGTTSPATKLHVNGDIGAYTSDWVATVSGSRLLMKTFASTGDTYSLIQAQDVGGDSNNALVLQPYGDNVGIGTTSPGQKLSVAPDTDISAEIGRAHIGYVGWGDYAGFSHVDRNSTTDYSLLQSASGNTYLNAASGNDIRFRINNEDKAILNSSGNVGIGTTSPAQKLEVVSPSTDTATFRNSVGQQTVTFGSTTNTSYSDIILKTNSGQGEIFKAGTGYAAYGGALALNIYNSNGPIAFHPSNGSANAMFIATNSNVGIGTTNPAAKLSVVGSGENGGIFFGNSGAQEHRFYSSANSQFNTIGSSDPIWHWAQYTGVGVAPNYKMTLNSTGLGIGETNPDSKLHIVNPDGGSYRFGYGGSSDVYFDSDTVYFRTDNGGANLMTSTVDGLGIGTTNPSQKLHVVGNARVTGAYYDSNNSAGTSGQVLSSTATGTDWVSLSEISGVDGTGTANYVAKWSDTDTITNSVIYDNGTNVGIGTTSPTYPLEVNGIIKTSSSFLGTTAIIQKVTALNTNGIQFTNNGGSEKMRITDAGDVGIGTTSPSAKLDVVGNVKIGDNSLIFSDASITLDIDYNNNQTDRTLRVTQHGGANELFRIQENGNVGIGTSSPATKLDVNGATYVRNVIYGYAGAGNQYGGLSWNSTDDGFLFLKSANVTKVIINSNGNSYFNGGNVGIGETNPTAKLHVSTLTAAYNTAIAKFEDTWSVAAVKFSNVSPSNIAIQGYAQNSPTTPLNLIFQNEGANVGIGTTSPSEKLEVIGTIKQKTGAGYSNYVQQSVYEAQLTFSTFSVNQTTYPSAIKFSPNGSEAMRVDNDGNVGIGTTSPSGKLDVTGDIWLNGDNVNSAYYLRINKGATSDGGILLYRGLSTIDWQIVNNTTSGDLGFYSYGTSSQVFNVQKSSGNVGIGTTAPSYKLEIGAVGSGVISAKLTQTYEKVRYNTFDLLGYNDGHLWMIGNNNPSIVLGESWNWDRQVEFAYTPNTTGAGEGYLEIGQTNKNSTNYTHGITKFFTNGAERMRIDSSGNVGIGTVSPTDKLHVNQGSDAFRGITIEGTTPALYLKDTQATNAYHIGANANYLYFLEDSNQSGGYNSIMAYWDPSNNFIFQTGNVGIGYTSPSYKLSVAGGIQAGGKITYTKAYGSLDTTGVAVAGLTSSSNGSSALFTFTCFGGDGYQKIVYSCKNISGNWYTSKDIDEGVNAFDVVASANSTTITFTFKGRSAAQAYSPTVIVEAAGSSAINSTYA